MGIRFPLQVAASFDDSAEVGAGSVGGGVPHLFTLPQDTDNVTVKLIASVAGGGVSAQLQTTDDGGTTWYGNGRTSIVSNAVGDNAEWMSISVTGTQPSSSSIVAVGSVIATGATGSAQPSTLASKDISGLPILSQQARVIVQITGNITSAASNQIVTQIKVNSQSATA